MTTIVPTVGRVVWFFPEQEVHEQRFPNQPPPYAAHVCFVHPQEPAEDGVVTNSDFYCVNLMVITPKGHTEPVLDVPLIQEGQPEPLDTAYCKWMPYQIGQAKQAPNPPTGA